MATVIVDRVVKIYKSGSFRVTALSDLSLTIRSSEFRIIAGPSGSGKTTLLNIIGGLDKPDAGKVLVNNVDITLFDEKMLLEYRSKSVGFVFQFFNLIPYLTALENVMVPMHLTNMSREEKKRRAKYLLELVGLKGKEDALPHHLSGGEQQRVAIATALANDPPLILADEPTGELDLSTSKRIVELFKKLNRELGKTIVIVTHDVAIAPYADRISIMRDGRIIDTVTPAEKRLVELMNLDSHRRIDTLIDKRNKILNEIEKLESDFKTGLITLDELVSRYQRLKSELDKIEEEIGKFSY